MRTSASGTRISAWARAVSPRTPAAALAPARVVVRLAGRLDPRTVVDRVVVDRVAVDRVAAPVRAVEPRAAELRADDVRAAGAVARDEAVLPAPFTLVPRVPEPPAPFVLPVLEADGAEVPSEVDVRLLGVLVVGVLASAAAEPAAPAEAVRVDVLRVVAI
ncbi:hypothetical protein [Frankia sp. R82]|uniref:hypothetical protein n=1 Tax=Frankia sp. R82 TaxID=2950553 RepID=UPI0020434BCE|nr:hypothetical protein [Frankia sp. R82]MCM3885443.1 hypothetical protein [Frankia sp. R82]